jgi:glycosyltransferase involved in cell wall biosynthesis
MELSSKKTITLFCPVTLPLKSGAGINAFNLAKEFLKLAYNVRVVSFRRENHSVFDNIEGIDIVRIPYSDNKIIRLLCYFIIIPIFTYYLSKSNLAIVFGPLQGYMSLFISGKVLRKKVVFRSTMYGVDDLSSLNNKFGAKLYRLRQKINGLMGGYISQSIAMTESFVNEYKISIPVFESAQGVDTEKFKPISVFEKSDIKEKLNIDIDKKTKIILSIGYVIERKGYREVFDSLAKFEDEDFLYIVIGKYKTKEFEYMYHENENMQKLHIYGKNKLKNKILFIGECNNVEDYYKIADLFILNSKKEGMPNVLLEAMASSLPVIVTSLPGVDNYITKNNVNALVVCENQSLNNALHLLFKNKKLASNLANNARKFIHENYNFTLYTKKLLKKFTK